MKISFMALVSIISVSMLVAGVYLIVTNENPDYSVTFDTGMSEEYIVQSYTSGSLIERPEDPVSDISVFKGWFPTGGSGKEWDFENDTVNKNITLYAKWEGILNAHNVTLENKINSAQLGQIYNMTNQQNVQDEIDQLKAENTYTSAFPLMIRDPYGTHPLAMYVYFTTDSPVSVEYVVSSENIEDDFTRIVGYGNVFTGSHINFGYEHEFLVLGFQNDENMKLEINCYTNSKGIQLSGSSAFNIYLVADQWMLATKKMPMTATDMSKVSDGLFFISGGAGYLFYDNYGHMRGYMRAYTNSAVHLDENYNMIFEGEQEKVVVVNHLGKVLRIYETPGYFAHHDMTLGGNNDILKLADRTGVLGLNNQKEDIIISIDRDTGEFKELLDFRTFFTYNHDTTNHGDWLHMNSLSLIDEKDGTYSLLISGREPSAIMKIKDIYGTPSVAWIMTDNNNFKSIYTDLKKTVRPDSEDLTPRPNLGQHTITFMENVPGGYIIYFFNNFFPYNDSGNNFDFAGLDMTKFGEVSLIDVYFINEADEECYLIRSIEVPYSNYMSSVNFLSFAEVYLGESTNILAHSSYARMITEFDEEGNMLLQLTMNLDCYRCIKLYI